MPYQVNRTHCVDCLEAMPALGPKSVSVIVTSPPYNIGANYTTYYDKLPRNLYIAWMRSVAGAMAYVLDDDGSLFLNIAGTPRDQWLPFDVATVFRDAFELQNTIHWIKTISLPDNSTIGHYKPINSERFHHNGHEYIFHFTKGGDVQLHKLAIGVPYMDPTNVQRWSTKQLVHDRGNVWCIPYETTQRARDLNAANVDARETRSTI